MIISMKQAAEIVSRNFSGTNPKKVIDYDSNRYVVEAPKIKDGPDFGMPFYYVTKDGNEFGRFNPTEDLDVFIDKAETAYVIK